MDSLTSRLSGTPRRRRPLTPHRYLVDRPRDPPGSVFSMLRNIRVNRHHNRHHETPTVIGCEAFPEHARGVFLGEADQLQEKLGIPRVISVDAAVMHRIFL